MHRAPYFFGDSHIEAVLEAIRLRGPARHYSAVSLHYFFEDNDPLKLNLDTFVRAIARHPDVEPLYVSMVGGNGHNLFGLFRHPHPFDFLLPEAADEPLDPGSAPQTYGFMKAALRRHIAPTFDLLTTARGALPGRMVQLESPAPPESDDYIRENWTGDDAAELRARSLASPGLRYKLWRLHSAIVQEECEARGIEFVAAPAESLAGGRYLRPEYYGNATHANARYGELLLRQVEDLMRA